MDSARGHNTWEEVIPDVSGSISLNQTNLNENPDYGWELERLQLEKTEEIRHALSNKTELIATLRDRLRAQQASYLKAKGQISALKQEFKRSEGLNLELRQQLSILKEENKVLKTNQAHLRSENERLSKLQNKCSSSDIEVRTMREDIKRLEQVESKLRYELKRVEESKDVEIRRFKKVSGEEKGILEEQMRQMVRRCADLERAVRKEQEDKLCMDVQAKHLSLEKSEVDSKVKQAEGRIKELERKVAVEAKRAEEAERRALGALKKLEEIENAKDGERGILETELRLLQNNRSDLEIKIETIKEEMEREIKDREMQLETCSKELRRKNAEVFELENKIRGMIFLNERKLSKSDREWDARTKQIIDEMAEKEERVSYILQQFHNFTGRLQKSETECHLLRLQRDYLTGLLNEFLSFRGKLDSVLAQVFSESLEQSSAKPENRVIPGRKKLSLRQVAWAITFVIVLGKQITPKFRNVKEVPLSSKLVDVVPSDKKSSDFGEARKPSRENSRGERLLLIEKGSLAKHPFAWSSEAILASSRSCTKERLAFILENLKRHVESSLVCEVLRRKYTKIKNTLARSLVDEHALNERIRQLESTNQYLEESLSDSVSKVKAYKANEMSLQNRIETLERDTLLSGSHHSKEREELVELLAISDRKVAAMSRKLSQIQSSLDICERERQNAIVEAKAAREMAARLEKYADAEISSLSKVMERGHIS